MNLAAETPVAPSVDPTSPSALRTWLEAHVQHPRFARAQWGIVISSLDTGIELFATNAGRLFVPASNTKLFTGALALDLLGPDFRIRTSLYAALPPDRRGRLKGNLVVFGRGDPTFAARYHDGDIHRALAPLVNAAAQSGLRRVDGALIADASFFRGPPLGSGWDWDDLEFAYGGAVSALSLNENAVGVVARPGPAVGAPAALELSPPCGFLVVSNRAVTVASASLGTLRLRRSLGSNLVIAEGEIPLGQTSITETVSVPDPPRWFGEVLRDEFVRQGIKVKRPARTLSALDGGPASAGPANPVELASIESPPLADMLPLMMKPSQNQQAQLLLLQCGEAWARRAPAESKLETSEQAGLAALTNFLDHVGVAPGDVMFEEGTGLSRRNLATPRAVVQLLHFMDRHPSARVFRDALPVAGRDGTLRTRMRGTPAAGNARAKTGYVAFTYALSGYVTTLAGERLAFALLLNNYRTPDPDRPARVELDDIVVALAGLNGKTSASMR